MADPAKQKGTIPCESPPPYTPAMSGPSHNWSMPMQAPPSVIHPNVVISSNVRIHNPSSVKINGMPLTTIYGPQMAGTTFVCPGYQQTTGYVAGPGFQSMQSMQSSGPGQMQQSTVIPGTGIVISQNMSGGPPAAGPTGAYNY